MRDSPAGAGARVLWTYLDIRHPLVAWAAYIGRVDSVCHRVSADFTPISLRAASSLRAAVQGEPRRLAVEAQLERVRKEHFPQAVSRLTGFYSFEDEESAARAERWGGDGSHFRRPFLVLVGVAPERVTRVDSEWITHRFDDPDEAWMHAYWSGEPLGRDPLWEILVEGSGFIWGTELRERAWGVLTQVVPSSTLLADVCRIAQEVGEFDFGRIVPYIRSVGTQQYRVDYLLDWRDAQNEELHRRLGAYRGPRNATLVGEPRVPDLRPYGFGFRLEASAEYDASSSSPPDHGEPPRRSGAE